MKNIKYIIKSINPRDSIQARNPKLTFYVDWSGEIYNGWEFYDMSERKEIFSGEIKEI